MYPAMGLALWASLSDPGQDPGALEVVLRYGLSIVGVGAWGLDRFRPLAFRGANILRVILGALLGVALGLMLGRHFVEPFRLDVVLQIVVLTALGAAFLTVDLLRGRTVRRVRDCGETSRPEVGAQ